jgi:hypothetical protein
MIDSLLGLSVARGIPTEVVSGLITGMYRLDGGVIRWAANTENAGQMRLLQNYCVLKGYVRINPCSAMIFLKRCSLTG